MTPLFVKQNLGMLIKVKGASSRRGRRNFYWRHSVTELKDFPHMKTHS